MIILPQTNLQTNERVRVEVMPEVVQPRHGFHHTVDSALLTLLRLGAGTDRITIRKAGRGWRRSRVSEQQPAAGKPLTQEMMVELTVEGDSMFHHLPVGMREASGEGEIGNAIRDLRMAGVPEREVRRAIKKAYKHFYC